MGTKLAAMVADRSLALPFGARGGVVRGGTEDGFRSVKASFAGGWLSPPGGGGHPDSSRSRPVLAEGLMVAPRIKQPVHEAVDVVENGGSSRKLFDLMIVRIEASMKKTR